MSLEAILSKYISSADHVFAQLELVNDLIKIGSGDSARVVDLAKAYLEDAKYYRDQGKPEVSLASVAYCEGLLDALRLLGAAKFEWPTKKEREKKRS